MREELKLDLEIPANSSHRIEIYNIRGQKVTSFRDATDKTGTLSYVWNGRDTSGRACAPGIYLVKLFVNDRPIRSKRICRIGS
jgi:flagellar hook assembly protein FlgD